MNLKIDDVLSFLQETRLKPVTRVQTNKILLIKNVTY